MSEVKEKVESCCFWATGLFCVATIGVATLFCLGFQDVVVKVMEVLCRIG